MDSIGVIEKKIISKKTEDNQFLPDELVINIFKRLPSKSVARCRLVCKGWRDVTLSRDFLDLVSRNSIPTILVTNPRCYSRLELFALDNWWDEHEPAESKLLIHKFPYYSGKFPNTSRALFSHAGLIVLSEDPYPSSEAKFIILNPARPFRECVRINLSKQLRKSKVYGVYFHPILKEYCSLWKIESVDTWSQPKQILYKILNLGSDPILRTISNPFCNRLETWGTSPLFINNYLYWLLDSQQEFGNDGRNDIMQFNIITEEFMVIACPLPLNTEYYQTRLLDIDGVVSFLLMFPSKISIWRMEDHAEQLWTFNEYTLSIDISRVDLLVKIVVVDGKLGILLDGRLVVFNLIEGSVKNYQKRKFNDDVLFLSHQMSLASLNNCKSAIAIDLNDKVVSARV